MSTQGFNARKLLSQVWGEYKKTSEPVKLVDKISLGLLFVFLIEFALTIGFKIKQTPGNMSLLIFPVFIAGILFSMRRDLRILSNENTSTEDASTLKAKLRRDFLVRVGISLILLLIAVLFPY